MLTDQQQAVVDWAQSSDHGKSLMCIARAGTGKTFTLIQAIQALIAEGESEIVMCAFNKAIADELKAKLKDLGIDWKQAEAATIHSLALRAWKKVANRDLKIDGNKLYTIMAEHNEPIYSDQRTTIAKLVSLAKNLGFGITKVVDDHSEWYDMIEHYAIELDDHYSFDSIINAAIGVFHASTERNYDLIDFDDMVHAPLYHGAKIWPKRFVMVDEAQDLSPLRRAFVKALAGKNGTLIFVGDDRQAIYGFSGADTNSIKAIQEETNAETLYLTKTFRCGRKIVDVAKKIVPDYEAMSEREGEVHYGETPENLGAGDAVISRKNATLLVMAYDFLSKGVGCKVEGRDIGMGLEKLAKRWKRITTTAALLDKLDQYLDRETQKWLAKGKPEKVEQIEDQVHCLQVIIARVKAKDLDSVDAVVAEIRSMFDDQVEDVLVLTTAHKSKGREWDRVVIIDYQGLLHCSWDKLPWQARQSENLAYVAVTRAIEKLYIN